MFHIKHCNANYFGKRLVYPTEAVSIAVLIFDLDNLLTLMRNKYDAKLLPKILYVKINV